MFIHQAVGYQEENRVGAASLYRMPYKAKEKEKCALKKLAQVVFTLKLLVQEKLKE